MENERNENIFYLNLKHVQNFIPIRCFLHNKWAQNMAAEEKKKKKKKVGKPIGDPVGTGCPN